MPNEFSVWWPSLLGAAATVAAVPLIIISSILSGGGPGVELHHSEFTTEGARKIGNDLGVDWRKVDLEQFRMGLDVEMEHGLRDPQTNVTSDDPVLTGKIAWAHLKELPDYYTRLKKVEGKMSSNPGRGNPDHEAKINARFEPLREKKKSEWRTKGYPEGLINKALTWAEEYSIGMASKITADPELHKRIELELYPKSLDMSQHWIEGLMEFLK